MEVIVFSTLTCILLGVFDIIFEVTKPKVNYINMSTDKLKKYSSIKILQISDIHGTRAKYLLKWVLKQAIKLKPDFIVLTGDIIDNSTVDFKYIYKFFDSLKSINPNIYFVSGNHEHKNIYGTKFVNELKRKNIKVINNDNDIIKLYNKEINIIGVDDISTNYDNINKAISNINYNNYTILLSHTPLIVSDKKSHKSDLILSGHTHGGQVRLPIIGPLAYPGDGKYKKYNKGIYNITNKTKLYIDSGLGTRLIPIRFLNRSQISLINVKNI